MLSVSLKKLLARTSLALDGISNEVLVSTDISKAPQVFNSDWKKRHFQRSGERQLWPIVGNREDAKNITSSH